jgi:PAS domain S-box-containing protein
MQHSQSFTRLERRADPPHTDRPDRRGQQLARIASSIAIATGVVVLIGWQLDIAILKSALPGFVSMKVNTAICFVWTGIALRLKTRQPQSARGLPIANGCAIGSIFIALLTICEYLLGWNLGIDELLFRDLGTLGTVAPGRMGINTAVSFCLTGAALLLINSPERRPSNQPQHQVQVDRIAIAQIMTAVAGLMAVQAIVSYAYNVRLSTMTTSMALHTTLGLAMLCAGILGLRSDRGFMRSLTTELMGGQSARRFIPAAILAPAIVGWLVLRGLEANLYDTNFALSLMSISLTAIWLGQIRINAGILNQMDYDRIRSSDRMRSSRERLKLALRAAKQGIWDVDAQTNTLTWDDRCKAIFGFSPNAVVTLAQALEKIHPDDRQRVADAVESAIRTDREYVQEYRIIDADGTVCWVLAQGRVDRQTATVERLLGTMMDITDRKNAELNERFLNELTRRLRQVTDADEIQWEAARSLGAYLDVDRVTWSQVDWAQRLVTIERDWHREGLPDAAGIYALGNSLPPELQVAMFAGDTVAIDDVMTEPLMAPYLDSYRQFGTSAIVKIPCLAEGRWVATLRVSTQKVRDWREDEIGLMQAVVRQIWSSAEQTRAAQALRAEVERTRAAQAIVAQQLGEIEAIYQTAPVGLCFVDTDFRYVRINEQLAQINGLSVSEHIGHTFREVLPELADTIEPLYRQVMESGAAIIDLEIGGTNRAQPGVERHWLASFYPQTDDRGQLVGVNNVVQEITERKRQAAALWEGEERFRTLADNMSQLAWMTEPDGGIFWYNRRWFEYTGTTLAQMQGWGWQHVHHPEHVDRVVAHFRRYLELGEPWEDTFPLRGEDGEYRWFLSRAIPIVDESGQVIRWFGTNTDITEQQATLLELKRAQADLKDRNQELDSFVHVVAHDLKAPLRGIASLSQWIEDDLEGVLSTEIQQHTILLQSRVRRMEATIDGLLDYARIGRSDEQIELVDVSELVAETIDSLGYALGTGSDSPPTVKIVIDPNLPKLHTKRLFLSQVFTNLIGNSIKHHDRIDGSIQISCQDCGDFYEFMVADNGPGIAPAQHDRVFEIFTAINPQNRADSTGIGLAIVKKIIETEGGTIRLESEIGSGTKFYFSWLKRSLADFDVSPRARLCQQ